MDQPFEYVFPAIRGVQAGREYYVSMCPLRLIPRIFLFDEEELEISPEMRAQRVLNRGRLPEMERYILENPRGYTFSALTASIDAEVIFKALGEGHGTKDIGCLHVPMSATFIINDGQHRRAAIAQALKEEPRLRNETIAIVFFLDVGLERSQQMFADLNRYAVRPSTSLGLLYDHRDERAQLTRRVALGSQLFKEVVEKERSALSRRSRKLFTLSAIHKATGALLNGLDELTDDPCQLAIDYWEGVAKQIPEWDLVRRSRMTAGEVRRDFLHSHAVALHALGIAGCALIQKYPKTWNKQLKRLKGLNWSRANTKQWEGRTMIGGRVSKSSQSVILTANVLKEQLGLPLADKEKRAEEAFQRGEHG